MRTLSLMIALGLVACSPAEDTLEDVNATGGVATEGGGNPYDQQHPDEAPPDTEKADGFRYEIPELPTLVDPKIVVSLEGLTVELIDEETGFYKVYPTGVGAKNSQGVSFSPVGEFTTGPDTSDTWYYYPRRYNPAYFAGFPFLRLTAKNSKGYHTYGLHGPITERLIRGFVSHGCMRMEGEDVVEVFYMVKDHANTPVKIQTEKRYVRDADGEFILDEDGEKIVVDVTPEDQDPVAAYQASLVQCEDDAYVDGDVIEVGVYEVQLCDEEDTDTLAVDLQEGDLLKVKAVSEAEIALSLSMGEALAEGVAEETEEEAEEPAALRAELRAAEAGQALINLSGAAASVALFIEIEAFTPAEPDPEADPDEADSEADPDEADPEADPAPEGE